jgi:hypothetical protein
MARCEGYYKLENRRCDRDGARELRAADGELYLVCDYHTRQVWTGMVARWNGQTGIRASAPADLKSKPARAAFVA